MADTIIPCNRWPEQHRDLQSCAADFDLEILCANLPYMGEFDLEKTANAKLPRATMAALTW